MTFPLEHSGLWIMLGVGVLFGFFLEAGGLASPRKLTAQLRLKDWTVFKVMFTAIVVAGVGLFLSDLIGFLPLAALKVPTPLFWAMAVGGALLGIGMAVGGYCPGTAVAGLFTGRLDGLFFLLGMVGGVWLFAKNCNRLQGLMIAGMGREGETLVTLVGLPGWLILIALAAMLWGGFRLGRWLETRGGGVIDAPALHKD